MQLASNDVQELAPCMIIHAWWKYQGHELHSLNIDPFEISGADRTRLQNVSIAIIWSRV
jgi:hypothetical protein